MSSTLTQFFISSNCQTCLHLSDSFTVDRLCGGRGSHGEGQHVAVREGRLGNERAEVELLVRGSNFQLLAIGRTGV